MSRRYVTPVAVVALLLLCAGLLIPGVQKVREAAARMSCAMHFYQVGLAHHNYASSFGGQLVAGTVPHSDLPPDQRLSWWVPILSHVERDEVFRQFDLTRGAGDPRNARAASNRIDILVCPWSGEPNRDTLVWTSPTPMTHYVGVAGIGADAAELP